MLNVVFASEALLMLAVGNLNLSLDIGTGGSSFMVGSAVKLNEARRGGFGPRMKSVVVMMLPYVSTTRSPLLEATSTPRMGSDGKLREREDSTVAS